MWSNNESEVYYFEYCKTCKHFDKKEEEEPCDECLGETVNVDSHKPVRWEEKKK